MRLERAEPVMDASLGKALPGHGIAAEHQTTLRLVLKRVGVGGPLTRGSAFSRVGRHAMRFDSHEAGNGNPERPEGNLDHRQGLQDVA